MRLTLIGAAAKPMTVSAMLHPVVAPNTLARKFRITALTSVALLFALFTNPSALAAPNAEQKVEIATLFATLQRAEAPDVDSEQILMTLAEVKREAARCAEKYSDRWEWRLLEGMAAFDRAAWQDKRNLEDVIAARKCAQLLVASDSFSQGNELSLAFVGELQKRGWFDGKGAMAVYEDFFNRRDDWKEAERKQNEIFEAERQLERKKATKSELDALQRAINAEREKMRKGEGFAAWIAFLRRHGFNQENVWICPAWVLRIADGKIVGLDPSATSCDEFLFGAEVAATPSFRKQQLPQLKAVLRLLLN